ncbi:MAG TPA: hypothetical protein VFV38_21675 [Ktedonobacteraceae bacterium]|nr:hypothetical protein [Ktedonobacteraceae bacterium]
MPKDDLEKKHTLSQETLEALCARYEQMVRNLYRYQAGTIALLEMLAEWARQELVESAEAKQFGITFCFTQVAQPLEPRQI